MTRYISEHPEMEDWFKVEAKARRELKKRFGEMLYFKRDLKPHGNLRRKYGQYSIHMGQGGCVVKNLTIEALRDNLNSILNGIPAPIKEIDGWKYYPEVDINRK